MKLGDPVVGDRPVIDGKEHFVTLFSALLCHACPQFLASAPRAVLICRNYGDPHRICLRLRAMLLAGVMGGSNLKQEVLCGAPEAVRVSMVPERQELFEHAREAVQPSFWNASAYVPVRGLFHETGNGLGVMEVCTHG
jgi:hypothetical protein